MSNILIVDDDDLLLGLLTDFLRERGYECTPAESVAKARRHWSSRTFALTISDFNMPSETGLDLLRYVKSKSRATPFILMSADNNVRLRKTALGLGADACIGKPFRPQELLRRIESALGKEAASVSMH